MPPVVPAVGPSQQLSRREFARLMLSERRGTDKLFILTNDRYMRRENVGGVWQYSIVDAIDTFGDFKNDARRYWNDKKKALIGSNTELSETIGQLKLIAPDGKRRATDVAPLWVLLGILARLDTEASNDLTNAIFKSVAGGIENATLRYRAMNIENGLEWAANANHEQMKGLTIVPDSELKYWEK